jgi:hypothetical protein
VPDVFRCFIEPSRPTVRHRLRKVETGSVVRPLSDLLEPALRLKSTSFRGW